MQVLSVFARESRSARRGKGADDEAPGGKSTGHLASRAQYSRVRFLSAWRVHVPETRSNNRHGYAMVLRKRNKWHVLHCTNNMALVLLL